jgi:hypothetical protein
MYSILAEIEKIQELRTESFKFLNSQFKMNSPCPEGALACAKASAGRLEP